MTPIRRRNLLRAPVVLLVRVPVMATLALAVWLGGGALSLAIWLSRRLPAFERES